MAADHITTDDLTTHVQQIRQDIEAMSDRHPADSHRWASILRQLEELENDIDRLPDAAKVSPVDEVLEVGETYSAVVEDDGRNTNKGNPMVRIDGVVVFLRNAPTGSVDYGQEVDVTITTTFDTFARGVIPTAQVGDGDD